MTTATEKAQGTPTTNGMPGRWFIRCGWPTCRCSGSVQEKNGAHGAPYATNHSFWDVSIVVRRPAGV